MFKGIFWHPFHGCQSSVEIERIGKTEATLGNILVPNDACKSIQTFKQILVYLLKTSHSANRNLI